MVDKGNAGREGIHAVGEDMKTGLSRMLSQQEGEGFPEFRRSSILQRIRVLPGKIPRQRRTPGQCRQQYRQHHVHATRSHYADATRNLTFSAAGNRFHLHMFRPLVLYKKWVAVDLLISVDKTSETQKPWHMKSSQSGHETQGTANCV